jgi:paired amphipathic helix protein Sin3a
VYAQVTTLFHTAPDLLEDFKQFLPESAGQAKSTPGRANEEAPGVAALISTPQPGLRDGQKMPPLGSFAPPASASKDSKKRPRNDKQAPIPVPVIPEAANANNRIVPGAAPAGNKRAKLAHKPMTADVAAIEPTLTPIMPEPIGPSAAATSHQDEIAFFERVKKYLGNKTSFNEFLKICNLFSQSIIDRQTVYQKGSVFLAANPELLHFWKLFLNYEPKPILVDNRPAAPAEKVSLSNCRGYGPSYRLLPRRVS